MGLNLKRVFSLTTTEILYIVILTMLAVTLFTVISILDPVKTILVREEDQNDQIIKIGQEIIANQNNATKFLDEGRLLADQREDATVENLTQRIDILGNDTRALILQGRQGAEERFQEQQEDNDRDNHVQELILQNQEQIKNTQMINLQALNNTQMILEQQGDLKPEERERLINVLQGLPLALEQIINETKSDSEGAKRHRELTESVFEVINRTLVAVLNQNQNSTGTG